MIHARVLLLCAIGSFLACSKTDKTATTTTTSATAAATVTASATPSASAAAPAATSRTVAGTGEIPVWAADPMGTKCTTTAAAKARITALSSGKDAAMSAGTADPAALAKEVGADACGVTRKDLANALNDGGYERYKAKAYAEADRWWRAALVVRPSAVTPRYNLACGLALEGKAKDAVWAIQELARAANEGDASAVNSLEKAKSDADLVSIRDDEDFKKAIAVASSAGGVLVGPRKEPEISAAAVKLLPEEFRKVKDTMEVTTSGWITYAPALVNVWTWHPDASNELLVATIVDDPAKLGKPKGDMNQDYGAIGVYRRDASGKLSLLFSHKTGESPPTVAAKGNDIAYSFETMCATIKGSLKWSGTAVVMKEEPCSN